MDMSSEGQSFGTLPDGMKLKENNVKVETSSNHVWKLERYISTLLRAIISDVTISTSKGFGNTVTDLKESLASLCLWGESFDEVSLERICQYSGDLEQMMVELLSDIGQILTQINTCSTSALCNVDASENAGKKEVDDLCKGMSLLLITSDEGSLMQEDLSSDHESIDTIQILVSSLQNCVMCLMDLLPSMEKVLEEDSLPSMEEALADHQKTTSSVGGASISFPRKNSAANYVGLIVDRFPFGDSHLVERLGWANWQRHQLLRHGYTPDSTALEDKARRSSFSQRFKSQVPVLRCSLPARSINASAMDSQEALLSKEDVLEETFISLPILPSQASYDGSFRCPFCRQRLRDIHDEVDWMNHVFADIKPYICPHVECSHTTGFFRTRSEWEKHETSLHRTKKISLSSMIDSESHNSDAVAAVLLGKDHGEQSQQHPRSAASARPVERGNAISKECPLCRVTLEESIHGYIMHLAEHMELLALASLPPSAAPNSDGSPELWAPTTVQAMPETPRQQMQGKESSSLDDQYQRRERAHVDKGKLTQNRFQESRHKATLNSQALGKGSGNAADSVNWIWRCNECGYYWQPVTMDICPNGHLRDADSQLYRRPDFPG